MEEQLLNCPGSGDNESDNDDNMSHSSEDTQSWRIAGREKTGESRWPGGYGSA